MFTGLSQMSTEQKSWQLIQCNVYKLPSSTSSNIKCITIAHSPRLKVGIIKMLSCQISAWIQSWRGMWEWRAPAWSRSTMSKSWYAAQGDRFPLWVSLYLNLPISCLCLKSKNCKISLSNIFFNEINVFICNYPTIN